MTGNSYVNRNGDPKVAGETETNLLPPPPLSLCQDYIDSVMSVLPVWKYCN